MLLCVTIHRRIVEPFVALRGRCLLNGESVCGVCVCVWMTQQSVCSEKHALPLFSTTGTVTQCQLPQSVVCVSAWMKHS